MKYVKELTILYTHGVSDYGRYENTVCCIYESAFEFYIPLRNK